ncbi:low-density lipoprotein receptor class A domain-containing protein 4 isoform X3 [Pyxicephalus adspersus]|uniref:low-density lipoprotein receptor class A domain-containing protein 4 isoform X3 n=1 Tax=Pyxicephalus adspersus TaxID=30357 RepID=UPI003B5AB6A6
MSSDQFNTTLDDEQDAGIKDLFLVKAELEFVQIIIIIVVITVMVVVIVCLLNHYKLSTWSIINRQSQSRRQEEALQPERCLWPSDNLDSRQGASEVGKKRNSIKNIFIPKSPKRCDNTIELQIMYTSRSRDRFTTPSFMQRDRFSRFQPTYPYIQHEIDLPPTISLSDGEEPPPYQGPCTLQLRDPEQQMELNRESVRAPPNRTIFDSDLIDISLYNGGPCPPSSNSGISATNHSSNGRMEGPPPTYSEVMGHYPGSSYFHHQQNNTSSSQTSSRLTFQANDPESTIVPVNGKDRKPGNLV